MSERKSRRPGPRQRQGSISGSRPRPAARLGRSFPPWLTFFGFIFMVALSFLFIFFAARGCVATQQSTEIRKYVTSSASILGESANSGGKPLQVVLQNANGEPSKLDIQTLGKVASQERDLYKQALSNEEVPREFASSHPYLVSALGIRATAVERLREAGGGKPEDFQRTLASAMGDFKLSDRIIEGYYIPSSLEALQQAGQGSDKNYLYQPVPFMDYKALGFASPDVVSSNPDNPNALHGVEVAGVEVAGKTLSPGGNVNLTGSDELTFKVTVRNGGEVAEDNVPVQVILNTKAERQSRSAVIRRIEPQTTAVVQISGFRPGELNEVAGVTVEVGPVKYEKYKENNTITGTVTFGL